MSTAIWFISGDTKGASPFWGQAAHLAWDARFIAAANGCEPTADRVLMAIAARINRDKQYAYPGPETIAADTGLGERTVRRRIKDLVRIKVLLVDRKRKNRYRLNVVLIQECSRVIDMVHRLPRGHEPDDKEAIEKLKAFLATRSHGLENGHCDSESGHSVHQNGHHDPLTQYREQGTENKEEEEEEGNLTNSFLSGQNRVERKSPQQSPAPDPEASSLAGEIADAQAKDGYARRLADDMAHRLAEWFPYVFAQIGEERVRNAALESLNDRVKLRAWRKYTKKEYFLVTMQRMVDDHEDLQAVVPTSGPSVKPAVKQANRQHATPQQYTPSPMDALMN